METNGILHEQPLMNMGTVPQKIDEQHMQLFYNDLIE
jgi:hypothetical protein